MCAVSGTLIQYMLNTHIVIHTTAAAATAVHIQPQKQDGCVGFVALLRFFDCMLSLFFFSPCHITLRFSPFWEEQRALRAPRLRGADGDFATGPVLCRWWMGGWRVLEDGNWAGLGEILRVTRCKVAVKGLEELEEVPPDCKEMTLEVKSWG